MSQISKLFFGALLAGAVLPHANAAIFSFDSFTPPSNAPTPPAWLLGARGGAGLLADFGRGVGGF